MPATLTVHLVLPVSHVHRGLSSWMHDAVARGWTQWAEARVRCILKGGNPPPALNETDILLKGYIAGRSAGEDLE